MRKIEIDLSPRDKNLSLITSGYTYNVSISSSELGPFTLIFSNIQQGTVTIEENILSGYTGEVFIKIDPSDNCGNAIIPINLSNLSPTPTPTSSELGYRPILLSNPPGTLTAGQTCLITTGLTKYIDINWVITNGLIIYNDTSLTTRTYNSDPYNGNYAMLYDINNDKRYAVTFDPFGVINTITDCF